MTLDLRNRDILQIKQKGISQFEVEEQIKTFKKGNIKVDITEAATIGNGISRLDEPEKKRLIDYYDNHKAEYSLLKFVPASGAATRMFKSLHNFVNEFDPDKQELREYLDEQGDHDLQRFFKDIEKLPFYDKAIEKTKSLHSDFNETSHDLQYKLLVETILNRDGLYLSNLPKGLVPFHKYTSHTATAFEEHLIEAARYVENKGIVKCHFTVAEEDKEKFQQEWRAIQSRVEEKTGSKFEIHYSFQDPKTDTIAVDDNFNPFLTKDDELFFRPGGHGALIENLNQLEEEIVFLKNIDNVVTEEEIWNVVEYKKVLGGKLLQIKRKIDQYLNLIESDGLSDDKLKEIKDFIAKELFIKDDFNNSRSQEAIQELLHRPLRVCGMVKNEGEPGGGPFLVRDKNGVISLQIIEGAQIDNENPEQARIAKEATHFNPVDVVCSLRDHKGNSYDLHQYVDPETSFIADKTKDGKPLKALERPGLWNGAMAKWNTIFVEVPVNTFNPVKTVSDLLKESHQPS